MGVVIEELLSFEKAVSDLDEEGAGSSVTRFGQTLKEACWQEVSG